MRPCTSPEVSCGLFSGTLRHSFGLKGSAEVLHCLCLDHSQALPLAAVGKFGKDSAIWIVQFPFCLLWARQEVQAISGR